MSGFEIAGVVLRAIPLLISVLEHYKSGKSTIATFVKGQAQLDTLLFRLKNQKLAFFFDILDLLRSAKVEDVVEKTNITEAECLRTLRNTAETGARLQEYLGQHYERFIEMLGRYEACLKLIARKLKHIRRLPSVAKDDLGALLKANPPGNDGFAFQERIKFSIEKGRLTQLIEELNEDPLSLKTIIEGMRSQQEHTIKDPSMDSHKLAALLAQNRIPASKVRKKATQQKASPATFKLMIELEDVLQEAVVEVNTQNASLQRIKTNTSQLRTSINPPIHLSVPSIVVTQHVTTTLICSPTLNSGSLGLLDGPPENPAFFGDSLTLEEVLQRGTDNEEAGITYKEQTSLALDIACSIVQLRETLWLNSPFTSRIIKIITAGKKHKSVVKPFIEQTSEPMKPSSDEPSPETVLRELAILLLELWHHRTLESWCLKIGWEDITTPEGRLAAACKWMQATSERLPPYYLDAIEQCIGICCGRQRLWSDIQFLRLYCENIIIPPAGELQGVGRLGELG